MKEHFNEEWPERVERRAEEMYGLGDQIFDEGKAEGRIEGEAKGRIEALIYAIKNIMNTFECSLEKAMDSLRIPLEQRGMYRAAVLGN